MTEAISLFDSERCNLVAILKDDGYETDEIDDADSKSDIVQNDNVANIPKDQDSSTVDKEASDSGLADMTKATEREAGSGGGASTLASDSSTSDEHTREACQ